MSTVLKAIRGITALSASLSQFQTNGNSTYGILDAPTLPQYLSHEANGYPWGSTQPGYGIPNTGVTRYYTFSVSRDIKAPDLYNKSVILINDQFPGPLIEANWGDTIQVTVTNNIQNVPEGLTLHWHGQPQRGTPDQDGTPGVSQCPIAPGSTATYKFRAESFGTGWYHSHVSGQYTDGLYGPMVVYGPTPQPYDIDLGPVMLSEYNHDGYFKIIKDAYNLKFPVIDNNLINGKGTYNCSLEPSKGCTPYAGLSKFRFRQGKTHRLRLINTGDDGTQRFSIDGHKLTVIANDYVPVHPYETDTVTLGVGQRTDILVKGTGSGAYWMRSDLDVACLNLTATNSHGLAAVYYNGSDSHAIPNTTATPWSSGDCGNDPLNLTTPYYHQELPTPPATDLFNISFAQNATGQPNFLLNGSSFMTNYNDPLLPDAINGQRSFPKQRNVYNYGNAKIIRVILTTDYTVSHPIHLHGHDFSVVAQGYGQWDGKVQGDPSNPQRRDTQLMLRPLGDGRPTYLVLQWYSDNPGVWPLHCHTSIHVSAGLAFMFLEQPETLAKRPVSADIRRNCQSWAKFTASNIVNQIDSGIRV